MKKIWIIIADAGRARIFSKLEGIADLSLVREIDNPDGRAHNVDLVTDQRGKCEKGGSGVMSALEMRTEPHEQKVREFAHQLNAILHAAALHEDYQLLAVIAPAHFLGLLRAGMNPLPQHRLALCMAKDLSHLTQAELQSYLHEALRSPHAMVEVE
jgi:protein required for attachment to host cells